MHSEFKHAVGLGMKLSHESQKPAALEEPKLDLDVNIKEFGTQVLPNADMMRLEAEMSAMKIDKVNEKVFDEVKQDENKNKVDNSESEDEEVEGRKLHQLGGRWSQRNNKGKHHRHHGGRHGGGFCIFMFFVTYMGYMVTLNRFIRTLRRLTNLRAEQASPEIANDEEQGKPSKKCKKIKQKALIK